MRIASHSRRSTEEIRACRVCRDAPRYGAPLSHEPRPVFQVSPSARICIAGQAPGVRVHASGRPYTDPSGVRLRSWLGIGEDVFYDPEIVAVVAMGFCFPGLDANGGDLPPRRECAELWRKRMFAALPNLELILLVGQYAQKWYLELPRPAQAIRAIHPSIPRFPPSLPCADHCNPLSLWITHASVVNGCWPSKWPSRHGAHHRSVLSQPSDR